MDMAHAASIISWAYLFEGWWCDVQNKVLTQQLGTGQIPSPATNSGDNKLTSRHRCNWPLAADKSTQGLHRSVVM